jgi:ankyrin repeat protein
MLLISVRPGSAQKSSDEFYQDIRSNDIMALRTAITTHGVNYRDDRGSTPLMYAAALGNIHAMKLLLASGADVNGANAFGATALMWSATEPEMVRLLVTKGADVNAKSKIGRTPLMIAASSSGNAASVKFLLTKGAKVLVRDKFANTPMLAATAANDLEIVKLLIE